MNWKPKFPAWRPMAVSSSASSQIAQPRPEGNLGREAWPELPTTGSLKSSSSISVPHKTLPAEFRTPKRSIEKTTPLSKESRLAPQPRPTYSELLNPNASQRHSESNCVKSFLLLDSSITQSKNRTSKSNLSMPSARQFWRESKNTSDSKICYSPSQIFDANSLQRAVNEDSQSTFTYIHSLIKDNFELKNKVAFMTEQLEHETNNLKKTIHDYEKLHTIGKAKQHILWQFIRRLTAGGDGAQTPSSHPAISIAAVDMEPRSQQEPNWEDIRLDPNAQTFIPSADIHPTRVLGQESQMSAFIPTPLQLSRSPYSQSLITAPTTPVAPSQHIPIFSVPAPASPSILQAIIESIPPLFRAICPFSLTSMECPNTACQMKKLCPRFNSPTGFSTCPGSKGCRHLHERPTCLGEAEGLGCGYAQGSSPTEKGREKGKGKMNKWETDRRIHLRSMAHQNGCGLEEWRVRLVIAGLRRAHIEGLYKN